MATVGALGVVSLTFCKLSKIVSQNLCIAEIVLVMRISSWNFVCMPKAMLINVISGIVYFRKIIFKSSWTNSLKLHEWAAGVLGVNIWDKNSHYISFKPVSVHWVVFRGRSQQPGHPAKVGESPQGRPWPPQKLFQNIVWEPRVTRARYFPYSLV